MTFPLRVAREVVKEAFGENPDLAAGTVYELEKLAKAVIEKCAEIAAGSPEIRDRILALVTAEEA